LKKKVCIFLVSFLLLSNPFIFLSNGSSATFIRTNDVPEIDSYNSQEITHGSLPAEWKMKLLNASDGEPYDSFGYSVSVSGNSAVIGAPGDDNYTGVTYIFKRYGTTWSQTEKLTAADGVPDDGFGWAVSLDGDTCVIGAPGDNDNGNRSGAAYVFIYTGTTWILQAKLLASDGAPIDLFGSSVSINGKYILIGSIGDDDNGESTGSAYIFTYNGTTWIQQAKLLAFDETSYNGFGSSVGISGKYAVIGIESNEDENATGAAFVYSYNGDIWEEDTMLCAGTASFGFGVSVSIYNDRIMVGAPYAGSYKGAAYIFRHNETSWMLEANLTGTDEYFFEMFGWVVSISKEYATTVGISLWSHNPSLYMFKWNDTHWVLDEKVLLFDEPFGFRSWLSNTDTCILVGCEAHNLSGAALMVWKPQPFFQITCTGSTISVTNIGDANATDVLVNRGIDGGFILFGENKTVHFDEIVIGETKEARFGMIFGFGRTMIQFSVTCAEAVTYNQKQLAFIFFFFLMVR
jgi:hypothetical protein